MAFELKNVVPWGRNLEEYKLMFNLSVEDLQKDIAGFGDGPASFNAELSRIGGRVVSFDPLYQFDKEQIKKCIEETKDLVIEQAKANQTNFVWKNIRDVEQLENIRMEAMNVFLDDFQPSNEKYIVHELPNKTNFHEQSFDLGLSSHFLMLYEDLGVDFHIMSIQEMLRICREIRIFPLLNLNAEKSNILDEVIDYFSSGYKVEIVGVDYEFQKNGNEMLVISNLC